MSLRHDWSSNKQDLFRYKVWEVRNLPGFNLEQLDGVVIGERQEKNRIGQRGD